MTSGPMRLLVVRTDAVDDRRLIEDILGLPAGAPVDVVVPVRAEASGWLNGDAVVVVAEGPARAFVSLRLASLHRSDAGTGSVRVTLGAYPAIASPNRVQAYLEARLGVGTPRLSEDGPPLAPSDAPEQAWKVAVEHLAAIEPRFASTCFLRVEAVSQLDTATQIVLQTKPTTEVGVTDASIVILDANGREIDLLEVEPRCVATVQQSVDSIRIEVQHADLHGQLSAFDVRAPAEAMQSAHGHTPSSHAAREAESRAASFGGAFEVFSFVLSEAPMQPGPRATLAGQLSSLDPEDRRLHVAQAKALIENAAPDAALEVLRSIPDGLRTAEVHALIVDAVLATGNAEALEPHIERAAFDEWAFDQLVRAIEGLPDAVRDAVVTRLCEVLSSERMADIVARVGDRLTRGPRLGTIARRVAEASPGDALKLLERTGPAEDLPTDLLPLILELRMQIDPAGAGEVMAVLAERLVQSGRTGDAARAAQGVAAALDWRESQRIAEILINGLQRLSSSEWTDDHELEAYVAADLAKAAVRSARDIDLLEAFEISAHFREGLAPLAPAVADSFDDLDDELTEAWRSSSPLRMTIEDIADAIAQSIRDHYATKRVLIVGGRTPDWWDSVQADLALDRSSDWIEVEPGRKPSMDRLKALVAGGRISLLVIVTDYIGHSTSAIGDFAKERKIKTVPTRSGRASFLRALQRAVG